MPYRYRAPMYNRRYFNQGFNGYTSAYPKDNMGSSEKDEVPDDNGLQKTFEIPMPNEIDAEISNEADAKVSEEASPRLMQAHKQSFVDILRSRIHLDDIILILLIFLLIEEGLKDEFLLILLLYIFLF